MGHVGTLARWAVMAAMLAMVAGCVEAPRPLPEPPTFRSILAVPQPKAVYVPLVAGPSDRLGKGLAATYSAVAGCEDARRLGAGWLYDWSAYPPECEHLVSLPMVWRFGSKSCPALGDGPVVLGFNEPDRPDQMNLTPDEAAVLWHRLTVECYPDRVFATPAVFLSQSSVRGLEWMSDWVTAWVRRYGETLPPARYMAVHCYSWTTGAACIQRLKEAEAWARGHMLDGMIVTEWAVLPCGIGSAAALRESELVRAWLDANPYVVGHAWFAGRIRGDETWGFKPHLACDTAMLDFQTGELTVYGVWYAQH